MAKRKKKGMAKRKNYRVIEVFCILSERPYTSELVILFFKLCFIRAALYVRTCDFVVQIVFYPSGPIRPNL